MRVCNVRVNWEGKLKGRHKDRLARIFHESLAATTDMAVLLSEL
jgi:hypothetical protein